MCDELGDIEYLRSYIKDKSPSCLIDNQRVGCSEKEIDFIRKWDSKDIEAVSKELSRLENMRNAKLTAELQKWQIQRIGLLKQLHKKLEVAAKEL